MDEMPIELVQKVSATVKLQIAAVASGYAGGERQHLDALSALAFVALVFVDGVCDLALREHAARPK